MPRQCVRGGPLPGPSMRCCAPARQMRPKNVQLRALRIRHGAFGDGVLRRYAASRAALIATLTSIVGPGLRPRRRQHANMVTRPSLTPHVTLNTAPVGLGARWRSDVVGNRLVVHRQCHAHPIALECFSRQQANPAWRIGFGRSLLRRASASAVARGQIGRGATVPRDVTWPEGQQSPSRSIVSPALHSRDGTGGDGSAGSGVVSPGVSRVMTGWVILQVPLSCRVVPGGQSSRGRLRAVPSIQYAP